MGLGVGTREGRDCAPTSLMQAQKIGCFSLSCPCVDQATQVAHSEKLDSL